jgi:uncharacterized protein (TIGR02145 family)
MKKILLFSAFFCAISAHAQNYLITFAGAGASSSVQSIKVENLATGALLTLNGTDILHLVGTTGINSVEDGRSPELKVFPNPSPGSSRLQLLPPSPGDAVIALFDITGRQVARIKSYLENDLQEFQISGLNSGLYLISVEGNTYHYSGRLLSSSSTKSNIIGIERITGNHSVKTNQSVNEDKGSLATVDMAYTTGDRLKFTGTSGNYSTVFVDIPEQDKTITFNFAACTDYENNNYKVVVIGTQTWMAENLKSTKYNDGALIPLVSDSLEWLGLTTPGYCWYRNNEATNKNIYGALYNFYTATSTKLCPTGWRVPSDLEWNTLITFLGGSGVAGGKMKESGLTHWYQPNTLATNESGFTGLPAGWRGSTSRFQEMYVCGEFWTSTPNTYDNGGYSYYLDYWYKAIYGENVNKKVGFSIRCIKY